MSVESIRNRVRAIAEASLHGGQGGRGIGGSGGKSSGGEIGTAHTSASPAGDSPVQPRGSSGGGGGSSGGIPSTSPGEGAKDAGRSASSGPGGTGEAPGADKGTAGTASESGDTRSAGRVRQDSPELRERPRRESGESLGSFLARSRKWHRERREAGIESHAAGSQRDPAAESRSDAAARRAQAGQAQSDIPRSVSESEISAPVSKRLSFKPKDIYAGGWDITFQIPVAFFGGEPEIWYLAEEQAEDLGECTDRCIKSLPYANAIEKGVEKWGPWLVLAQALTVALGSRASAQRKLNEIRRSPTTPVEEKMRRILTEGNGKQERRLPPDYIPAGEQPIRASDAARLSVKQLFTYGT